MKKEYSKPEILSFDIDDSDMITTSDPNLKQGESNTNYLNLSKRRDALTEMLEESEEY